jgi:hypothetical protein
MRIVQIIQGEILFRSRFAGAIEAEAGRRNFFELQFQTDSSLFPAYRFTMASQAWKMRS